MKTAIVLKTIHGGAFNVITVKTPENKGTCIIRALHQPENKGTSPAL